MDDTMHDALDGALAPDGLSPAQRARLAEAEHLFATVVEAVREEPMPDLAPAVLRTLAARQRVVVTPERRGAWWDWLWRPRPVTLPWRPAYAIAAVALLVVAAASLPRRAEGPTPAPVLTRFELSAPGAHRVSLAGGFTNWQPDIDLAPGPDGTWTVVVPLDPGIHTYAFVIDGERWVPDPASPAYDDGFGGQNSRLTLLPPDGVPQ